MSFAVVTGLLDQFRRSVPLADTSLKNPNATLPLLQGEWLYNTANGYARITAVDTGDTHATTLFGKPVPVISERGDSSVQAVGKVAVIEHGPSYRARTNIYKTDGLTTSSYARGTELTVAALDSDGDDDHAGRTVLKPAASSASNVVVAIVETPPDSMGEDLYINVLPSPRIKA